MVIPREVRTQMKNYFLSTNHPSRIVSCWFTLAPYKSFPISTRPTKSLPPGFWPVSDNFLIKYPPTNKGMYVCMYVCMYKWMDGWVDEGNKWLIFAGSRSF
jgi:hypothetical protein